MAFLHIRSAAQRKNMRGNEGGFTLLFAAFTSSLLLAISLSILNISLKESQLTGIARESQFAFYAADAGVECALYWDDPLRDAFNIDAATSIITCAGSVFSVGDSTGVSEFLMTFSGVPYCVNVTVTRTAVPYATKIESRGSNTCDINSTRRVERAIIVTY